MKLHSHQIKKFSGSLLQPRAILVGLTIFISFSAYASWAIIHRELETGGWLQDEDHFYPPLFVFLLPLSAITIYTRRTLGYLAAMFFSGYIIYDHFFWALRSWANAHDESYFSPQNISRWWNDTYTYQPKELLYLGLASLLFLFAAFLLSKKVYCLTAVCIRRLKVKKFSLS